jgi:Tol biopolymer transport system component
MVVNRNGTHHRVILRGPALRRRGLEAQVSSWSPDGEYLALNMSDLTDPDSRSAVYTLEIDSGDLRRLTPWWLSAADPDWSPDGTRILFNSNVCCKQHSSIYTTAPDGSAQRRLTNPAKRFTFEGSFSPSGNQIVYSVVGPGVTLHLARMTLGGETRKRITRPMFRGVEAAWGARP